MAKRKKICGEYDTLELQGRISVDMNEISKEHRHIVDTTCKNLLLFDKNQENSVSVSGAILTNIDVQQQSISTSRNVTTAEGHTATVWDVGYKITGVWTGSKSMEMKDTEAFKKAMNSLKRLTATVERALLESYEVKFITKKMGEEKGGGSTSPVLHPDLVDIETVIEVFLTIRNTLPKIKPEWDIRLAPLKKRRKNRQYKEEEEEEEEDHLTVDVKDETKHQEDEENKGGGFVASIAKYALKPFIPW